MIENSAPEASATSPQPMPRRTRPVSWGALAILAIALLLGAYFRATALFTWDEPSFRLHPDERFMIMVASDIHLPSSLGEYLDSSVNPLNPRNRGKPLYVYGMLPQLLTRATAVLLTPNDRLAPTVPNPRAPDTNNAPPVPNPELSVPKLTLLQPLLNPQRVDLTDFYQIYKIGRFYAALFDLGSILLTFLIARRLYGARAGALAALLYALSALPSQLSHFFTVDTATGFCVLLAIYWSVRVAQGGGLGSYTALGISIGAAMACRVTMAVLGLLAVVAVAQRLWGVREPPRGYPTEGQELSGDERRTTNDELPRASRVSHLSSPAHLLTQFGLLALAGILSVLSFRMLQPDAFMGTSFFDLRPEPRFIANIVEIGQYVSGVAESPPSDQWANRTAYVFPFVNMVLWGMGLPFGIAAWAAWAWAGWRLLRRRALVHLIPWLSIALYFLWQGGILNPSMRYFIVLYGLFAGFAAWALLALWDWGRKTKDERRKTGASSFVLRPPSSVIGRLALAFVVIGTLCWAYAFTRIYTRPHSRIAASRWIYQNIPPGSTISAEQWDDSLPLNLDGRSASQYQGVEMFPYFEDDPIKYTGWVDAKGQENVGLLEQLDRLDYIILSSNRVYDSTSRLPMRFPALTRYYHYLFSGELGFEQVADITSYPTLFGIPIPDQSAEEAWSVYDHPRVLIFKKTSAYSHERAKQLITGDVAWGEVYKLPVVRVGRAPTALRLTEDQWPAFRDAGTWYQLFNPAGLTNQLPWLFWLLALELLGLGLFPLLFRLLPGLPDRGFALAKTLGLLLVAYGAWLLGSLNILAFTPASVWLCAALLLLAGWLVARRERAALLAFVRARRMALLSAEGLFLLAYFGFLLIRAANPDLWHPARGGEKPMDLAFLTAVLKSASFPPYDPWFAGGFINYYYFGFVFVGALVHMTGIVPTVAYNLAVPTVFALTALGAWGAGYNLIAPRMLNAKVKMQKAEDEPFAFSILPFALERRAIATGIVAAVFVVLAGNLANAIWFLPGTATPPYPSEPAECQLSSYAAKESCKGRDEWVFWDATRLVSLSLSTPERNDGTIAEFPFFTFLYGDLHAHMIALPLALAALGLMVALCRGRGSGIRGRRSEGESLIPNPQLLTPVVLLALVVGALRATNTWDYPTYLGMGVLTLGLLAWQRWQRGDRFMSVLVRWALASLGLLLLSNLLFLPFTRSFATDYAGFQIWRGAHTLAKDTLIVNGLWLFLLGSAALALYRRTGQHGAWGLAVAAGALVLAAAAVVLRWNALVLLIPLAGAALGVLFGLLGVRETTNDERRTIGEQAHDFVSLPTIGARSPIPDPRSPPRTSLTTLLPVLWAVAAIWLTLLVELVTARGDIGRMNTVFKLGMQSWVLFAVPSAIALTWLWSLVGQPTNDERRTRTENRVPRPAILDPGSSILGLLSAWTWRGAAALLIAGALVYPVSATPARLADRFDPSIGPTLDGAAYMRSDKAGWAENNVSFSFAEDADALAWMREHIRGTPIVLEAQTEAYRWGGRVSIYTGLPTLLGWPGHESQQRAVVQVDPVLASRRALVTQIYNSTVPSETLQLLQLYGVEYVYVGQLERALYDPAGLATFDSMAAAGQLQRVYSKGQTSIYQALPADHPPALLTTSLPVRAPTLPPEKNQQLSLPVDQLPATNDYAWNRLADSQPFAVIFWLLAGYILLLLGLPLAALVFRGWRDGGYAWARLIGLLLLGYAVWLPVSARLWNYNRVGLALGLLLVLVLDAAAIAWMGRTTNDERRTMDDDAIGPSSLIIHPSSFTRGLLALRDHFAARRRTIIVAEVLFLGAFALMAALRMLNPDMWHPIWGGEKPFEFGFLNAILRSPVMPPYDPFFSDGTINYYYYGLFLVSLPLKATGIAPAIGFNLIIPTLFALTVVGAFALVAELTGRVRYGLLGAAFLALLGNLAAAFPIGDSRGLAPVRVALAGGLSGFGARLGDWFWGPSRVIYEPGKLITINEFPYWSFLFADLHPHLIALPIALLMIAIAFAMLDQQPYGRHIWRPYGRPYARWLLAALVLGVLAVTNSWDFPTYALLLGGALIGRVWRGWPGRRTTNDERRTTNEDSDGSSSSVRRPSSYPLWLHLAGALATTAAICGGALVLYLPFFQNFQARVGGVGRVEQGSSIVPYLLIYGLYLAVLAPLAFAAVWRLLRYRERLARGPGAGHAAQAELEAPVLGIVANPPQSSYPAPGRWRRLRRLLLIVPVLLLVVAVAQPVLGLKLWLGALALLGLIALLPRRSSPEAWFTLWLAVVAWAVSLGIELFYIRDHLDGGDAERMNTVFKFGFQVWVLLALAAAAALPRLMRGLRRVGALAETAGWAVLAALVALALVFPLAGTPSRLATRFPLQPGPTLDGLAFMEQAEFDVAPQDMGLSAGDLPIHIALRGDGAAIRWLNEHIEGTPIVLQSDLWFYRPYGTRIAANTGLPTIVSPLHASEQHDPDQVAERDQDVQTIYRTTDTDQALELLSKYHVGYVYVGQIERAAYGEEGAAKFDQMAGAYLDRVYDADGVKIFKVDESVYSIAAQPIGVPSRPVVAPRPQPAAQPPAGEPSLEALEQQVKANPTVAALAFGLGQRYYIEQRYDDAIAVLNRAAIANPTDVPLHHLLGDVLSDAGRADEAEAAYRAAVSADPSAGNYNKLGVGMLKLGRIDTAAEAFAQAIAADPSVAEPYFHLGEVYEKQGQNAQAVEQYQKYLELAPKDAPFRADATLAIERLK
jgi:YYY domain-containing protein